MAVQALTLSLRHAVLPKQYLEKSSLRFQKNSPGALGAHRFPFEEFLHEGDWNATKSVQTHRFVFKHVTLIPDIN